MGHQTNTENFKAAATALNIKMYYGLLAKAENRANEFSVAMYLHHEDKKSYMSHITPEQIAAMTDTNYIMMVTTLNGRKQYKTFTKRSLCNTSFHAARDRFLANSEHTAKRAAATKTTSIYNMLINSVRKLADEEAIYEKMAIEAAMQDAYMAQCQYGNCNDAAWQEGLS